MYDYIGVGFLCCLSSVCGQCEGLEFEDEWMRSHAFLFTHYSCDRGNTTFFAILKRSIYFSTRDEFFRVGIDQIVYFVADGNYTFMQLSTGQKLAFTFSLQKMQSYLMEKLDEDARTFARVGKAHIINLAYVYHIDVPRQRLRLLVPIVGKEFPLSISKEALKNLRAVFSLK